MKKILIIIGDAGGGHISAARAIEETFKKLFPGEYSITIIDILRESGVKPFKNSFQLYKMVNENWFYELVYDFTALLLSTRIGYFIYKQYVIAKLYRVTKRIISGNKPDLVIANNSIITPLIENMKKEGALFKTVVLVTDIVHIFQGWADRFADLVISPTHEATKRLVYYGVDPHRIRQPLFPINPQLVNFRPRHEVLAELGFMQNGRTTILVTAGGFGVLSLEYALDKLIADPRLQIIVLAGRIDEFRRELKKRYEGNPRVKIFGFVDNIQDYYHVSDIILGKPGPATIMEAELFQKKAVLTKRVGIQEKGNAEFAVRNPNFRSVGARWWRLKREVDRLLERKDTPFLERRRFDESEKIVREIVKLMEHGAVRAAGPAGRNNPTAQERMKHR